MASTEWLVSIAVFLGASASAACGATTPPSRQPPNMPAPSTAPTQKTLAEVHKRGGDKLIAEVGPNGGTLELGNGARISIPRGAFSAPIEMTFAEGTRTTAFANHEYEKPVGPILEIAPGVQPAVPLQVSVPIPTLPEGFAASDLTLGLEVMADLQRAVQMQGVQTRWDYLPAQSQNGRAIAELSVVPGYRLQFLVSRSD